MEALKISYGVTNVSLLASSRDTSISLFPFLSKKIGCVCTVRFPRNGKFLLRDNRVTLHAQFLRSTVSRYKGATRVSATLETVSAGEILPPPLDSSSDPPPLFDGTTRLYISYTCPYAQRVWITRNCKGLEDKIRLVPIDLQNRPAWYKENVNPANKVPALEHNNEVKGESLDLIRYVDSHFEGPSLFPDDPVKKEFAEELFSYTDTFNKAVVSSLNGKINGASDAFDHIEKALSKFDDGPFLLGQFSLVDIAFAPFIERFEPVLLDVKNYDITSGRPKLTAWIEEMNKIEAYKRTRHDPKEHVERYRRRFLGN
ncbi:protein IN2-1 homolog B [Carica papaya]|uniref:protein IN2-1 homolog B n=1 Tax=Carica papaya TaxID=3649 RepID=UPI000B8C8A6C|nr:protein IN2-1 homolog B [Carica papaya]